MSALALSLESLKTIAQEIHFISFDVVQFRDSEMRSHWYKHESVDIDLYYFQNPEGHVIKIHVSIFGQVLEWTYLDGLRTGLLVEEETPAGVSEVIQYDARFNTETLQQGLEILRHAKAMDYEQRQRLVRCLGLEQGVIVSFWKKLFKRFF